MEAKPPTNEFSATNSRPEDPEFFELPVFDEQMLPHAPLEWAAMQAVLDMLGPHIRVQPAYEERRRAKLLMEPFEM